MKTSCILANHHGRSKYQNLEERAICCIRNILQHDIHSRNLMLASLFHTACTNSPDVAELIKSTAKDCRPRVNSWIGYNKRDIVRHCDKNGDLVHILEEEHCTKACSVEHRLVLDSRDVLLLSMSEGTSLPVSRDLIPVFAGRKPNGQKLFVAYSSNSFESCNLSTIITYENIKPTCRQYTVDDGEGRRVRGSVRLPILRHSPRGYSRRYGSDEFMVGEDDGLDATGPYSWKFHRYIPQLG